MKTIAGNCSQLKLSCWTAYFLHWDYQVASSDDLLCLYKHRYICTIELKSYLNTEAKLSFAPLAIQSWITMIKIKRRKNFKIRKSFLLIKFLKIATKAQKIQNKITCTIWNFTRSFWIAKKTVLDWNRTPGLYHLKHEGYSNLEESQTLKKVALGAYADKNEPKDDSPNKHKNSSLQKKTRPSRIRTTTLYYLKQRCYLYASCAV